MFLLSSIFFCLMLFFSSASLRSFSDAASWSSLCAFSIAAFNSLFFFACFSGDNFCSPILWMFQNYIPNPFSQNHGNNDADNSYLTVASTSEQVFTLLLSVAVSNIPHQPAVPPLSNKNIPHNPRGNQNHNNKRTNGNITNNTQQQQQQQQQRQQQQLQQQQQQQRHHHHR